LLLIGAKCLKEEIDVKKRLQINSSIFEFFIRFFLLLASLLYLNGCTLTPKALQLANEKAAPQYEYWNIKRIESVVKQENGDVSLCVELNNAGEIEEPKLNTITIPLAILNGEANQHERHGFYPGECPLLCYWYPIEKVENGCDKNTPENLSTKSILPIEKLTIYSQDQLYEFINSYNENQKIPDKIFEVKYVSRDISEIYWFAQIDQQRTSPISIAGVYDDKSTKLYYLTVPPAILGDGIIVVVGTAVVITGIALGVYLQLL
jgi:hypothetical protein